MSPAFHDKDHVTGACCRAYPIFTFWEVSTIRLNPGSQRKPREIERWLYRSRGNRRDSQSKPRRRQANHTGKPKQYSGVDQVTLLKGGNTWQQKRKIQREGWQDEATERVARIARKPAEAVEQLDGYLGLLASLGRRGERGCAHLFLTRCAFSVLCLRAVRLKNFRFQ